LSIELTAVSIGTILPSLVHFNYGFSIKYERLQIVN
jgi:hypothetical protein